MKELTQHECDLVAGGDRNLGTLYQYTGDERDMDANERFERGLFRFMNMLTEAFDRAWH